MRSNLENIVYCMLAFFGDEIAKILHKNESQEIQLVLQYVSNVIQNLYKVKIPIYWGWTLGYEVMTHIFYFCHLDEQNLEFYGTKKDGKEQKEPGGQAGLGMERGNEGELEGGSQMEGRGTGGSWKQGKRGRELKRVSRPGGS